jgi:hypothetical protein
MPDRRFRKKLRPDPPSIQHRAGQGHRTGVPGTGKPGECMPASIGIAACPRPGSVSVTDRALTAARECDEDEPLPRQHLGNQQRHGRVRSGFQVQMEVTPACCRVRVDSPPECLDLAEIRGNATLRTRARRKDVESCSASTAAAVQRLPPDLPRRWNWQRAGWRRVVVPLVAGVVRDGVVRTADDAGDRACGEPSANTDDDHHQRDQQGDGDRRSGTQAPPLALSRFSCVHETDSQAPSGLDANARWAPLGFGGSR